MREAVPYRTFADFLAERFSGKMQKLTVDAGFTCPNRDGTVGTGGCIYCNNSSFTPQNGRGAPVAQQIAAAKSFFARKYPQMRYLAYFQSYTGTHAPVPALLKLYREALAQPQVDGIIIGTRPDCMPDPLLAELKAMRRSTFVMVEYGAESSHNSTLETINRCHSWEQTVDAVERTAAAGIETGLHLINGLPGETPDMMLATVDAVNALPVEVVKFHQMQIVRGTELARRYEHGEANVWDFSVESYLDICVEIVRRMRRDIAIERFVSQSPASMLISPRWGLKNYEFTARLLKKLLLSKF
ncbi:MAG: TIGR01212 family radical SAM protein [Paramuribaculum sp.]|nr:TIGR01212 family radical SAM protein [Paramuribaculum sp.]